MIVAIYTRLSPNPKKGDTINQERDLLEYCKKSNWTIYKIYKDIHVSGSKKGTDRPQFTAMMLDASRKKFDVVLFWSLDRFSREGTYETMTYLRTLSEYGVGFKSYSDPILDTTNEMIRDIVITVMSAMAKQERVRLIERTRLGIETARLKGKTLGRPIVGREEIARIKQFRIEGKTLKQIAKLIHYTTKTGKPRVVSEATIYRLLKGEMINANTKEN